MIEYKTHLIFDFTFIYYKYTFQLMSGKIKRLSALWGETQVDISQMYYAMKEIESIRKKMKETYGDDVVVSICLDSKSMRKDAEHGETYKDGRKQVLGSDDYENIITLGNIMEEIGYNVYKVDGYEADDLVYNVCEKYADNYIRNIIVTCDKDLYMNIRNNVAVYRYKQKLGYELVTKEVYDKGIHYNGIMLYKSTVGDSSDKIKGIPRFGEKAYEKYQAYLIEQGVDFTKLGNADEVEKVLKESIGYLGEEQIQSALDSLAMVRPISIDGDELNKHGVFDTDDKRNDVYRSIGFVSIA